MGAGDLDDGRVPPPQEADPWVGSVVVGRYAVEAELGWGSLGRVFRVRDELAGAPRTLALKAVRRDRLSPETERYLRHEYRCLAGLDHPHLVGVHGFDRADGIPFFLLDAIEGETLVAAVRRGGWERAPGLLAEALRSLAYLHQRGWLHLDLKPQNLLVDTSERVRVIDLHLARRRGESGDGTMRGTIAYMPPEVIRGREVDGRADLYGLGAVAYEALCGQAPFGEAATPMAVLRGHAQRQPLSFAARGAEVPERLENWVRCLLAKDPNERYPDAHEALRALGGATGLELPLETAATRRAYLRRGPLIERGAERRLVLDAAQALREGATPTPLVIRGEAGSGRTRLLEWLAPRVAVDGLVPLRLSPARTADASGLGAALPPLLVRHGLAPLCPEGILDLEGLSEQAAEQAPGLDLPSGARQAAAIAELIARLAEREHLVLLVDDLEQADPLMRAVLDELLAGGAPLLVVACTTLEAEVEWARATTHRLRLLTRPGAAALIAGLAGREDDPPSDALAERLWELTGGSPRHLSEVVRGLSRDGALVDAEGRLALRSADLERVLKRADLGSLAAERIARLEPEPRRLLLACAVCPGPRPVAFLQAMAASPPAMARAALDELRQLGFVRDLPGGLLSLDHAPLAEAARALAGGETLSQLHARALQLLESRHPATISLGEGGDRAEELLWHAEAAGESLRAWECALQAARAAARLGDHARAARCYRRALSLHGPASRDEGARREVLAGLALALGQSGGRAEALGLLADAGAGLAPWATGLRLRARLLKDQGELLRAGQDLAQAREAAESSAALGETEGHVEVAAVQAEEASLALWRGDYAEAREAGLRCLSSLNARWPQLLAEGPSAEVGPLLRDEVLRRHLEQAAAEALDALHHACHFLGADEAATRYLERALGGKLRRGSGRLGEPGAEEARAALKRALRHGRGPLLGDTSGAQVARSPVEAAFERADRSDDLVRLRERRARLLEASGDRDGAAYALLNLAHLRRARGRIDEAAEHYGRARALFSASGSRIGAALVDQSEARLLAQVGQAEGSRALAARAEHEARALGARWLEALARLALAEAAWAERDRGRAQVEVARARALAGELDNRPQLAELDLFEAELHLAGGDTFQGRARLESFNAAPAGSRSLSLKLWAELLALDLDPGPQPEQRAEEALGEAEARGLWELAWRLAWRRARLRGARGFAAGELEDAISALESVRRITLRLEPAWKEAYLRHPERAALSARFRELRPRV